MVQCPGTVTGAAPDRVRPGKRQSRAEKPRLPLARGMWPPAHCFLSLLALCAFGAEAVEREEMVGVLGSSVLLHPELKVDPIKNEILWTFISSHKSPLTILHHIPHYTTVQPSQQFVSRLQFNPSNGSLVVNRLATGDQGDYSFAVDGQELTITHLLLFDKLSEASILTNSSSFGSTIQLTCNVRGDPHGYQWWRHGREISQYHQLMDGNRSLVILGASRHDCGMYTCVGTNPVSSVQANYTLTIPGISPEDIAIATLSIIDLVISSMSLIACVSLRCTKKNSSEAVKKHKRLLGLSICNIVFLVALFVALICWIEIKGADPLLQTALCTASLLLLALILFNVRILSWLCFDFSQKKIEILNQAALGLLGIVILVSIAVLLGVIHQNNPGCDSSFITLRVFFGTRIWSVMNFLLHSAICRCGNRRI